MIDFRETMPAAGNKTMYIQNSDPTASTIGGLSVGVPGVFVLIISYFSMVYTEWTLLGITRLGKTSFSSWEAPLEKSVSARDKTGKEWIRGHCGSSCCSQ
jgi:hypothetical protein